MPLCLSGFAPLSPQGEKSLFLVDIRLKDFRNYQDERLSFSEPWTVVGGGNGQGKSNLLEGVYFLSVGKSARGSRDEQVVRYDQPGFALAASLSKGRQSFSLKVIYERVSGKRAYVDGQPVPRLSGLVGLFNSVLFSPEDVDLVLRFPAPRRRMLDILVSQASASYLSDLQDYTKALRQRNALLRGFRNRPPDHALLEPWNEQLVALGSRIIHKRRQAVDAVRGDLESLYATLSASRERVSVAYRSTVPGQDLEGIAEGFRARIRDRQARECDLGYTLTGPHRDNLAISVNGRDTQESASKGQLKCVLLSWKLAEASFLRAKTADQPVLLLDDAFSELDAARSSALLTLLEGFGQVLITSAREADLDLSGRRFRRIVIEDGRRVDTDLDNAQTPVPS